jgi:prepilin-type N-terminal cleavage/methylation domain-containing protein
MRQRAINKKNGFTLVEIMFVVAIIGLLAALSIPAILNAREKASERIMKAHIAEIEKAKGMLTLPALIYEQGKSIEPGTSFGEGDYTEENLTACITRISSLEEMIVDGKYIIPGDIDSKAYYTDIKPAYAE